MNIVAFVGLTVPVSPPQHCRFSAKSSHRQYTNEHVFVLIALWTLKFEFYTVFAMSQSTLDFFQPFKSVKTILSS